MRIIGPVLSLAAALTMTAVAVHARTARPQEGRIDAVDRLLPGQQANDAAAAAAGDAGQDPVEVRTTRALNAEVVARSQIAENQDRADQEAYELERARHQVIVDQAIRDRLAHEVAAREADDARRRWEVEQARRATNGPAAGSGDAGA